MNKNSIMTILSGSHVIPSVNTMEKFMYIITKSDSPCIMLKFGDINNIPHLVNMVHKHNKRILLYLDSIKGLARDNSAIKFLSQAGVDSIVTTKTQCIKSIKEEGIPAILCVFLIDSDALRTGIHSIQQFRPDAVNLMPASIPSGIIQEIRENTDITIIAGGLIRKIEEVDKAINKGIAAVITSEFGLCNRDKKNL